MQFPYVEMTIKNDLNLLILHLRIGNFVLFLGDVFFSMGKFCKRCGKIMKNPQLTHCSDECLLADLHSTKSKSTEGKDAKSWDEKSDPWV